MMRLPEFIVKDIDILMLSPITVLWVPSFFGNPNEERSQNAICEASGMRNNDRCNCGRTDYLAFLGLITEIHQILADFSRHSDQESEMKLTMLK